MWERGEGERGIWFEVGDKSRHERKAAERRGQQRCICGREGRGEKQWNMYKGGLSVVCSEGQRFV